MNQPAVRLSNRQYNVMREAVQSNGLALARMLQISQTTAGAIFRRGFFGWNRKTQLFELTKDGMTVMKQFSFTNCDRKDQTQPLSKYAPPVPNLPRKREWKKAKVA